MPEDGCGRNPRQALEQVIGLGCDRLLTSGQQPKALAGAELLANLVELAGGRIIVMPGSGINPSNIAEIERITKASEFHSTARASVPDPDRHHVPALGFDESADTGVILRTTREVVKALVNPA